MDDEIDDNDVSEADNIMVDGDNEIANDQHNIVNLHDQPILPEMHPSLT